MEDKWIEQLKELKCLPEEDVKLLCEKAKEIIVEESNVQYVSAPVIICGDIRGQIYDLMELFKKEGEVPNNRYIFMGNYLYIGNNNVEFIVIQFLLALKIKYPGYITLLRGSCESRNGGYDAIINEYGNANVYKYFIDLFDYLPWAALVEGKIFCVHSGLSRYSSNIEQIRLIYRKMDIPSIPKEGDISEEILYDLIFNYPDDNTSDWSIPCRGAGHLYGWKVVDEFNHINGLELVCRSSDIEMDGFKYWFKNKNLCTIFSAPNFHGNGNRGSILKISKELTKKIDFFASSKNTTSLSP